MLLTDSLFTFYIGGEQKYLSHVLVINTVQINVILSRIITLENLKSVGKRNCPQLRN